MTLTTLRTAAPAAERDLFAATVPGFAELRRELHQEPELSGSEVRTSARIAALLKAWGYEVETGVGGHGVVGTLVSGSGSRKLGLRADFDALPIHEQTGLSYASRTEGVMHACGHDGHTAILLAAASWLARTRGFDGTLRLIFQPAEETASGARAMLSDGLLERFPIDAIYGLHNWPGLPEGQFGFITGPAMAAVDQVSLTVKGRGGHGAAPHEAIDPVVISAYALTALQSIVSRNVNPLESAVVTAGSIHGGSASNIIPDEVDLKLTLRSFTPQTRDLLGERVQTLLRGVVEGLGGEAVLSYRRGIPAVTNHPQETEAARRLALALFGTDAVEPDLAPRMASEDFAFLLEAVPGSYLFVGTGPGAPLHSPLYQFNDSIIEPAAWFWVQLSRHYLSGGNA